MHTIEEMTFRRRFSINPYKRLRLPLGEMSCFKDWLNDRRGAPYPVVLSSEAEETLSESLPDTRYRAENKTDRPLYQARLLGQHFPCPLSAASSPTTCLRARRRRCTSASRRASPCRARRSSISRAASATRI